MKNKGFIFIETIIVVCVLTVALMSIYNNYSKIITNTKELNTFDTAEHNYKTYFLMKKYPPTHSGLTTNQCADISSNFSDDENVKICLLNNITNNGTKTIKQYLNTTLSDGSKQYTKLDAYIIDYLLNQDLTANNDNLYLVKYKKQDKLNSSVNYTYISSLNY